MLKLEIVTPERKVFDAEVDSVTVPTATGDAGILPNHAPLVSALKPGVVSYTAKGTSDKFAISGGFVEVSSDRVSVLADNAEGADEIDVVATKAERDAAEKALAAASQSPVEETAPLRERLELAQFKLQVASGK
ncbi:MAG TPA: ATP synthase F1 subunit epsilon [Pyrinomonadaceae bacterium]|nr:ATP synthase F1 subunit epsilon [Chloracidobacterium sp.]MBP9935337.1 ATP synthase F1 subunit epsilon [Pyrinomonadaceae bacterium]MBK7804512.1 ATP synthase F1 subunit epsilon [Chloracidobacterium sp.]MBK9438906.1 ATP synthase F1 subunit epsilon [Chloracidobacterium sp.]MBK9768408.1 ATP synthase F1 subunit epsilon [Chloracidobacterium sp.]